MKAKIVSKKEISTGILLKELKKEFHYSDDKICEKFEKLGKNIDRVTVNNWCNDKSKIREKNLEILSKIFDVDIEYLKCKQPCKKKNPLNDLLFDYEIHHYFDKNIEIAENVLKAFGVSVSYSEIYKENEFITDLVQKFENEGLVPTEITLSMIDNLNLRFDYKAIKEYTNFKEKLFQPVSKIIEENGKKYKVTKLSNFVNVECDYVVIKTDKKNLEDEYIFKNLVKSEEGMCSLPLNTDFYETYPNVLKISFSEYKEKVVNPIVEFKSQSFAYLFGI